MALRPERALLGPERPELRDIDALNRVFADAFTDRYLRDGLIGVRVPPLNPLVWRFAIEDAGEGAMIWRDGDGAVAAFNMVHRSGTEGWMGPLAVRTDRQGEGIGSTVVRAGIHWLQKMEARTIGLETMPRTVENIGFYSRLGLVPGPLTVTLIKDADTRTGGRHERLSGTSAWADRLEECRTLTSAVAPGVDFSRELILTIELGLGDVTMVRNGGELTGFALWHSAPLAAGRPKDELRVLKLVARNLEEFLRLVTALPLAAAEEQVRRRIAIRCQTQFPDAYQCLIRLGYRVHWTDLRMALREAPEQPAEGIIMSNWEI